jgi:hypothetical protein
LDFELVFDPIFPVIEVLLGEWVIAEQEATAANSCAQVKDRDFAWIEDFGSNDACHGKSPGQRNW